jgi:hypothetical protein
MIISLLTALILLGLTGCTDSREDKPVLGANSYNELFEIFDSEEAIDGSLSKPVTLRDIDKIEEVFLNIYAWVEPDANMNRIVEISGETGALAKTADSLFLYRTELESINPTDPLIDEIIAAEQLLNDSIGVLNVERDHLIRVVDNQYVLGFMFNPDASEINGNEYLYPDALYNATELINGTDTTAMPLEGQNFYNTELLNGMHARCFNIRLSNARVAHNTRPGNYNYINFLPRITENNEVIINFSGIGAKVLATMNVTYSE